MSGYDRDESYQQGRGEGDYGGRSQERPGYEGGTQGSYDTQGRESGGQNQSYYGDHDGNTQDNYGQGGSEERYNQGGNYDERQDDRRPQNQLGGITHSGNYGGGGGYGAQEDLSSAASHAEQHAGSSGDPSIFSSVLSALGQNKHTIQQEPVDEQDAVQSHQQFFGGGDGNQPANAGSMGSAAAIQALKMFTGGESGNSQSGNSQNAFIGMAMAQASKLFEQQSSQGNVASGASKESAIQHAGEMALKLYMQSQGKSGGSSGLLGLASKFL